MAERLRFDIGDAAVVHVVFTARTDGDMARGLDATLLDARRRAVAPHRWTWLEQVHGHRVVVVGEPGAETGARADAAVTRCAEAVLSVQVADCAPVLMFSAARDEVVLGVAHAGWRGLLDGVLDRTVDAMRRLGAGDIEWLVGPCITAAEYEFSEPDLIVLEDAFGPWVRASSHDGTAAFDLRVAVRSAMAATGCGNPLVVSDVCTTSETHWSHRRRGDMQRQVGAIWWERT